MQLISFTKIRYTNNIFFFILFFCSCNVSKSFKHYRYISDSVNVSHLTVQPYKMPKLQVGDRIQITVSALNLLAAQAFNQGGGQSSSGGGATTTTGYLINSSGNIKFPQIGNIKVEGLTTDSVENLIESRLEEFLKSPSVTVNQINFNINLLGEIGKAGILNVPDGKMTIIEAISRSGDLTLMGRRDNILVVREKNGKREFGRVDISSNSVFNSPYYYLEPGDLIYIDVNKDKLLVANNLLQKQLGLMTLIIGSITSIFILKNLLKL